MPGVSSMAVARMLCLSIMFAIGQLGNRTTGQLINQVIGKISIWANLNTPMSFVFVIYLPLPLWTMSKLLQEKEKGEERHFEADLQGTEITRLQAFIFDTFGI